MAGLELSGCDSKGRVTTREKGLESREHQIKVIVFYCTQPLLRDKRLGTRLTSKYAEAYV